MKLILDSASLHQGYTLTISVASVGCAKRFILHTN